jgi:murein DD-endopeptidase MepM/ murein hydrolase activator NlpD
MPLRFLPALLVAWTLSARGEPPRLTAEATPERPRQGGIVWLVVKSDRPLEALTAVDGERSAPLTPAPGGRAFRGLVGIDFESAAGSRAFSLEAVAGEEKSATPWRIVVRPGRFIVQKLGVDPKFVEVPEAERERVKADQALVAAVWKNPDEARHWTLPFVKPVQAPSQGNFGARRVYNGQARSRHAGLDLSAPMGAPVAASGTGRVALSADLYFSGGTVILDHGGGLFTMYFHLSRRDAREGEMVAAGARIGAVGATGRVTGPHLHWAARLHGARVNPAALLSGVPQSP